MRPVQPKELLGGKEPEPPGYAERKKARDEKAAKASKQRSWWEWFVGLSVASCRA